MEYRVVGDFDYYPFTFVDETGRPSGLDVEVLEAVAASSGLKLKFNLSEWHEAINSIKSGQSDIIIGIIYSEEREQFFEFSTPIHVEYYSIFIRKDLPLEDLSNLYDYRPVTLEQDVSIDKFLIPMGLYQNALVAKSLPEALSLIELGAADYVLAPNIIGLRAIKKNKFNNIEIKGPSVLPSIYTMAVTKGNTDLLGVLNEGIADLMKSGKLREIQEKWKIYEDEELEYKRISAITGIVLSVALILLSLIIFWVLLLRAQIRMKTRTLVEKNNELRRSEEKLRLITDNSSDVIWHLDANFIVTYISDADERIRGFKKEEVLGQSLFSILKPEGIETLVSANRKRMENLAKGVISPPVIYELEELCKDGQWVWVEATATACFDEKGNISGYHGVTRDISERKKSELLLKQKEQQLRELNATKDKLFSIIAHDLRSPFNAILSLSEMMVDCPEEIDEAESREYIEMIHSSAASTLSLLDNLLSWAKSQNGTNIYRPEMTDINEVFNEVSGSIRSASEIKNVSLLFNTPGPIEVFADVNMLKTILRNLISNAVKYSHPGGKIMISARKDEFHVEVVVSDSGIGMSTEVMQGLFQIGDTVSTKGTADEKGSGLGLLLCQEFVSKHAGEIRVNSEAGKGSEFIFTLPYPPSAGSV